jgi:hypothetical protein
MKKIFCFLMAICIFISGLFAQEEEEPDYFTSPFQFTFLFPPLSTNGIYNSRTVNRISLNLLIGHAGGVDGVELGSFINSDNYFARGFQVAGFGNIVGGSSSGAQLSGFFNVNGESAKSLQGAGFINIVGTDMSGAQLAGFLNINGNNTRGFQGSGFGNVSGGSVIGAQVSGFFNVSGDTTCGAQLAGFINVASRYDRGAQLAGFINISGQGALQTQVSGFFNRAKEIRGAQAAGFTNIAGNVKGLQLSGFLNVCDSIDGVPIGFISYVRKNGYRKFEFSSSEVSYANFSYKMGVRRLYNIYTIGKLPKDGTRWIIGAGFGYERDLGERMLLNIEAMAHQELWVADARTGRLFAFDRLNMVNQVRTNFGMILSDKVTMFFGPTVNVSVAESNPDLGRFGYYEIGPEWAWLNTTRNNVARTHVKIWIGINGGIRF